MEKKPPSIPIAALNAVLAIPALAFMDHFPLVRMLGGLSLLLFCCLCFMERKNILFLARTFILGFIGYFPMLVKILFGENAFFSGYERSTQGVDIVVLMYAATSFALLSNQIGLWWARKNTIIPFGMNDYSTSSPCGQINQIQVRQWKIAAVCGVVFAVVASYIFVRGYGQTILSASYASAEQGGLGITFGSTVVFGVVGIFSLFVAGMKGYIKRWKGAFVVICLIFIIYSQLLMGLRQDAITVLFGLLVLNGVVKRRSVDFKLSYLFIFIIAYIFFEAWGVARFALSSGISMTTILTDMFSGFGSADAIQMGTISPITTTFSNTVWLIHNNIIDYSFGQSYWEWILRIPPESLYPNRPADYAWMFEEYGLLAGGGFFELAEVYMNFGLPGALIVPGLISFLLARIYIFAFQRQSMLGYFFLFSFLAVLLRGTWYQSFAFFRAFLVCMILYVVYVSISRIEWAVIRRAEI